MLTITVGSTCDICLEDFSANLLPHSLPCGHLLCATCCTGIVRNALVDNKCPFCRRSFSPGDARPVRADFGEQAGDRGEAARAAPTRRAGNTAPPMPPPAFEQPEDHSAECDICKAGIRGKRYKCVQCPDWDACETCYMGTVPHVHPKHSFIRIHKQQDYLPARGDVLPSLLHSASCDICGNQIRGNRYHCMHSICSDFDLCANCEALPIRVHPIEHPLLKIQSGSIPQFRRNAHAATCDACGQQIFNVRYKCMSCHDFDLCEACETNPFPRHEPTHSMLKIKVPQPVAVNFNRGLRF